jgi:purine-binding chemotaxis protein CheW
MPEFLKLYLRDQRFGLALESVERVIRMVEITPLPEAPEMILGIINVHGCVIPVFNLPRRLGLQELPTDSRHHLIIARTARRRLALLAEAAAGLDEFAASDWIAAGAIFPDLRHLKGVAKMPDGLVLIHDLEKFLSLEEEEQLDTALENAELA